MPLYSVSFRLSWDIPGTNRRKWSNVFFKDAPTAVAAAAWGVGSWVQDLRNAARDRVFCYEVYATSVAPGDDDYTVQAVPVDSQRGTLPAPETDPYWPQTCLSVTMQAEAGRPSRKFWRVGLFEGDVTGGQTVTPGLVAAVTDVFNLFLENSLPQDPDGQALQVGAQVRLTSRQFGRESGENLPSPPPVLP